MGITTSYKNVHELLCKYLNIKFKLIDNKPRTVYYSSELQSKMNNESYLEVLKKIESKFKNGSNINLYLSRQSINPDNQDGLLNDWGIYHLHLSDKKDPKDNFYSRSDYLLMFIVGNDFVCFLDVRHHSETNPNNPDFPLWTRNELLEIIQNNWPKILDDFEFKGYKPSKKYSEEEHLKLRNAGITTCAFIGNKLYAPMGGGVTTARTGSLQTIHANRILNTICNNYREIKNNPDNIKNMMVKNEIEPPYKLNFCLIDEPKNGLVCLEKNSNWGFSLKIRL